MVRLNLQVAGCELDRHMAIVQLTGRARQVKRRAMRCAMRDAQYGLRRCNDPGHGAILGRQHVTAANQCSTRQKHAKLTAERVTCSRAAFLAYFPASSIMLARLKKLARAPSSAQ